MRIRHACTHEPGEWTCQLVCYLHCRTQPVLFFCPWSSLCDENPLLKAEGSLTFRTAGSVDMSAITASHHLPVRHISPSRAPAHPPSPDALAVSLQCAHQDSLEKERALAVMAPCVRRTRGYVCTVTRAPSAWGSLHLGHRGDETAVAGNCTVSLMEP